MNNNLDLRTLPKVELHRHLEGAIRLSTLVELAKAQGVALPTDAKLLRDFFLVEQPMQDLATVLAKFSRTQMLLSSEEILTRIAVEAIEDAVQDGIRILELRYAPDFILPGHPELTQVKIIEAISKSLALTAHLPIAVGFIAIFLRTQSLQKNQELCDIVLDKSHHFIGADLADDELSNRCATFFPVFSRLAKAKVPITIHAGEIPQPESPQNVIDAIEHLSAQRIGHGIMSIKDPVAMKILRDFKIPLEVSVTSNWLTRAVPSLTSHPIRDLIDKGISVTINSDDPGIFGIDLTNEYKLLYSKYQFQEAEFAACNDIAANASFIPLKQKQKYWPRPIQSST